MEKKTYLKIRKAYSDLGMKIVESEPESEKLIRIAGKRLGFLSGNTFVFEDEEETGQLMDFLLYEKVRYELRAVDRFRERKPVLSSLEEEILDSMINARNSVFEIGRINESEKTLTLFDLFTEEEYTLFEVGLSQSAGSGVLLYSRLLPIREVHITSGVSFPFFPQDKGRLLSSISRGKSRKRRFSSRKKKPARTLYEIAIECYRSFGIPVIHKNA